MGMLPGSLGGKTMPKLIDKSDSGGPAPGFGLLAQRIARWTTNLLATALVIVGCVVLGRHYLDWSGDPAAPSAALVSADSTIIHADLLEFGDEEFSLTRRIVTGSRAGAMKSLRSVCRETVADAPTAKETETERLLLAQLVGRRPREQQPGAWEIFEFAGAFPLVLVVRPASPEKNPSSKQKGVAQARRRMVAWGMVTPAGGKSWSVYLYRRAATDREETPGVPKIALPSDAQRTLTLRTVGGTMIGFRGKGPCGHWRVFFDRWFGQRKFDRSGDWYQRGGVWHASFRLQVLASSPSVEVQFGPGVSGELLGFITIVPASEGANP